MSASPWLEWCPDPLHPEHEWIKIFFPGPWHNAEQRVAPPSTEMQGTLMAPRSSPLGSDLARIPIASLFAHRQGRHLTTHVSHHPRSPHFQHIVAHDILCTECKKSGPPWSCAMGLVVFDLPCFCSQTTSTVCVAPLTVFCGGQSWQLLGWNGAPTFNTLKNSGQDLLAG